MPAILAIEDDLLDYELLERIISKVPDFQLSHSRSLASALAEITINPPDLIMLDLTLPDSTGLDVIATLSEKCDTPIVVLTGTSDESTAYNAVQRGAQDYLVKGTFDSVMLVKTIRYALERFRLVHELAESNSAIQRQQEQRRVQGSFPSQIPAVTASSYGQYSLREGNPENFKIFIGQYKTLLEDAVEQRAFKVDNEVPKRLRTLATELGTQRAVPRDVVELHTTAVEGLTDNTGPGKSDAYNEEGRYLLIGLLGHLCSFYRGYCHTLLPLPRAGMGEVEDGQLSKLGT